MNEFREEPQSENHSLRVGPKGGSDPGLWAAEPPQTRFARSVATGIAPALG
jgi:hypothetical protein